MFLHVAGLLLPCLLLGTGLLAAWVRLRFPRLRPRRLASAIAHVIVSLLAMTFAPVVFWASLTTFAPPVSVVLGVGAIVVPALCYVFVSWIWLIARVVDLGSGGPRGGKLVDARS